jgi:hypothetical protein
MHARLRIALSATLASLIITGCARTVVVTRGPQSTAPTATQQVAGIPIYVKRAYCQQQSVWVEPQYVITVSTDFDNYIPNSPSGLLVLDRRHYAESAATLAFLRNDDKKTFNLKDPAGCQAFLTASEMWGELQDLHRATAANDADLSAAQADGNITLIQNSASMVSYVDYQTLYYYNVSRPLIGTSNVDVKLAADGTMNEGSGSITDQTLSTILSTAASLFPPAGAAAAAANMVSSSGPPEKNACAHYGATTATIHYTEVDHTYRHTHTIRNANVGQADCTPMPLATAAICADKCELQITDATSSPDSDSDSDSKDKDSGPSKPKPKQITVTGTLTLPPDAATTTPPATPPATPKK